MNWFTSFLRRPPISWWDLVDILVVSILIYEVLKLIRGTRAAQMALGGGLFVALFYGSHWIHLAKTPAAEEPIEELVVAASRLSSQRVGAIIAVERQIGLRVYIEGGIRLD